MPKSFYQFYQEVSNKILDKIDRADVGSSIFGDKIRLVIPLTNSESSEFERNLETAGVQPDIKTGMVLSTIQTQRGPKQQQQRIGAFLSGKISRLEKQPDTPNLANNAELSHADWQKKQELDKWKKLLNWWEKNKAHLNKPKQDSRGVSIVISRSPIDIVRMSDHDEWHSCHAVDGSYFKCAVQEAKTGGAVAYVVHNSDLATIDDLQATDIFKDDDRDVEGIEPLERIRLRRFTGKIYRPVQHPFSPTGDILDTDDMRPTSASSVELLVPEIRTYGTKHVGFKSAVDNWAKHVQRDIIAANPDLKDFELHGGSYQDNEAGEIWSTFLGKSFRGSKKSVDKSDESDGEADADDMQERADEQIAGHNYEHWSVNAGAEDDGEHPYLYIDGNCCFKFPADKFQSIPEDKNLQTYFYSYSQSTKQEKQPWGNYLKKELQIYELGEEIYIEERDGEVRICLSCRPEGMDNDALEHFLDEVDDYDNNYDEHTNIIWKSLITYGFVEEEEESHEFKHFEFDPEDFELKSELMEIGDLTGINPQYISLDSRNREGLSSIRFHPGTDRRPYTAAIDKRNQIFGIPELKDTEVEVLADQIYHSLKKYDSETPNQSIDGLMKVYLRIHLFLPANPTKRSTSLEYYKQIDQNWDYYWRRAVNWFAHVKDQLLTAGRPAVAPIRGTWNGPIRYPQTPADKQKQLPLYSKEISRIS